MCRCGFRGRVSTRRSRGFREWRASVRRSGRARATPRSSVPCRASHVARSAPRALVLTVSRLPSGKTRDLLSGAILTQIGGPRYRTGCSFLCVADSPRLLITAERTGHDVEVAVQRGLEEPAAAHLLNRDEPAAEVLDPPQLGVVVLLRAGDYAEIQLSDLMRVQEAQAAALQPDDPGVGMRRNGWPFLGCDFD